MQNQYLFKILISSQNFKFKKSGNSRILLQIFIKYWYLAGNFSINLFFLSYAIILGFNLSKIWKSDETNISELHMYHKIKNIDVNFRNVVLESALLVRLTKISFINNVKKAK